MNKIDEITCWSYNLFDKERFKAIVASLGISLDVNFEDDAQVTSITELAAQRIQELNAGKISMSISDDARSFSVLRMAASVSRHGKSWYVQKESAVFESRVKPTSSTDIMDFMNMASPSGKKIIGAITASEGNNYPGDPLMAEHDRVKVRWERFPAMISNREFTVKKGWIYTTMDAVIVEFSKAFKRALEGNLTETTKKLAGSKFAGVLEPYAEMIDSMIDVPPLPAGALPADLISFSPPCMRLMDAQLARGGDIGYVGHIVLSFYLKSYLSRQELVDYFFTRNPTNSSYPSVDAYLASRKELDYIFKQMFGEAGGGTSYSSYACKRIATEGLCPFAALKSFNPNECKQRVTSLLEAIDREVMTSADDRTRENLIGFITKLCTSGYAGRACGVEFQSRFDPGAMRAVSNGSVMPREKKKYIAHPVKAYLEDVLRIKGRGQLHGSPSMMQ